MSTVQAVSAYLYSVNPKTALLRLRSKKTEAMMAVMELNELSANKEEIQTILYDIYGTYFNRNEIINIIETVRENYTELLETWKDIKNENN